MSTPAELEKHFFPSCKSGKTQHGTQTVENKDAYVRKDCDQKPEY